jgi:hypothetical protein
MYSPCDERAQSADHLFFCERIALTLGGTALLRQLWLNFQRLRTNAWHNRICSMGAFQDRERTESLRAAEERALEMMANGASLSEVLNDLCGAIDAHDPDIHSMVCLMDGEWLSPCAGPHVPATFKAAITPWKIGPQYRFVRHGRLYETTSDYPGRFERSAMAG